ncbi:zinc transporter ZIP1 [Lepeophtheirus salmonis]|uniref:zinc transporter ZIP1 n=1 Tax=Lepeophtheirus salmonis TaxID=72036 RepID=UPI001AE5FF7D|nr:zinc transporter ZIP1-like [Lepeophtheirus salmonis]
MSLLLVQKILVIVGVFISTVIFGTIPFKLASYGPSFSEYLTLSSCYSGGVFLAAFFLDLYPDLFEDFNGVISKLDFLHLDGYPLPSFFVLIGFFLVLIIEQIIHSYKDRHLHQIIPFEHDENKSIEGENEDQVRNFSIIRSFMLLIALAFHSFFEGLAIGLQTKQKNLLALVFAVMFHKGIMAFSLGINLTRAKVVLKVFMGCILIFSIASPIGIAMGIGLMNLPPSLSRDIVALILQAIAGGTFLYITFIEVLFHELNYNMHEGPDRMLRILCIILGFATIAIVLLIFPL